MSKLRLIIEREYMTRVRKKSFILTTLLTPIAFLIFIIVVMFLMTSGTDQKKVAVIDESGLLGLDSSALASNSQVVFEYNKTQKLETLKKTLEESDFDGILFIPKSDVQNSENVSELKTLKVEFYAYQQLGMNAQSYIQTVLAERLKSIKLSDLGIETAKLEKAEVKSSDIQFDPKNLGDKAGAEKEVSGSKIYVATFLGGVMMFLIYFVIMIYGNMVMRSVMEEKTSRIVEIIISSVKPFELMLGKIIGVGAVGLTQFGIWAITIPTLNFIVSLFFIGRLQNSNKMMETAPVNPDEIENFSEILQELWAFNYFEIFFFFLVFFLAGYVLYASLFAAIGAAMGDDWGEGQSLTMIVIIPVILAFYIGIAVIEDPNSSLGVFASIFPLFSPVVMPARIVFEPPMWQILLSVMLLLGSCWLFVWLSGRIYRAGILMYGKKTTLREFVKWMFIKE
jgi:ABC-2 type transport system permease protein